MSFTKVRFSDLNEAMQILLDALSTHRHDGIESISGIPDTPGGNRVSFLDLQDIPDEIINNPSTLIIGEIPTPSPNGIITVFTLANDILDDNKEAVYVHGIRKAPVDDYTALGDTLTFVEAPPSGSNILVDYQPVI